jgi:hypothetical protein
MNVTSEDKWLLEKRRQDQVIEDRSATHRFRRLLVWVSGLSFCTLVVSLTHCQVEEGRLEHAAEVEQLRLEVEQNIAVSESFVECLREASFSECQGTLPLPPSEEHELALRKIEIEKEHLAARRSLANKWFHKCLDEHQNQCDELVQNALKGL